MKQEVSRHKSAPRSMLGYGIKKLNGDHERFFVVDTNVLINDPNALDNLSQEGRNAVVVPWIVLSELDVLKKEQDISRQVMESVRNINGKQHAKDHNFYIAQGDISVCTDLNKNNPDHHIIALCLSIKKQYPDIPLTLISNDAMVHTVALRLNIEVEEYKADQVDQIDFQKSLPRLEFEHDWWLEEYDDENHRQYIGIRSELDDDFLPNSGALFVDKNTEFAGIKVESGVFEAIKPSINACGIMPYSPYPGQINWAQYLAFRQALDPSIGLVTFHGQAGTGKTLISIAAAVKQLLTKGIYRKIMIARPFVHLGNKDTMGFLKGDMAAKTSVWLQPLYDNLDFLSSLSERNKIDIGMLMSSQEQGIEILPLSYIRGRTLSGVFLIIDEAQNLTKAEVKTIVTRAGEDTKIILVGDIDQIDIRWIDKRSSGLTHVTAKMQNLPYFGNTYLNVSVRSQMAKDAAELL